ncbi:hypothetical protein ACQ4PT_037590 [Festuca glaucescens]
MRPSAKLQPSARTREGTATNRSSTTSPSQGLPCLNHIAPGSPPAHQDPATLENGAGAFTAVWTGRKGGPALHGFGVPDLCHGGLPQTDEGVGRRNIGLKLGYMYEHDCAVAGFNQCLEQKLKKWYFVLALGA